MLILYMLTKKERKKRKEKHRCLCTNVSQFSLYLLIMYINTWTISNSPIKQHVCTFTIRLFTTSDNHLS